MVSKEKMASALDIDLGTPHIEANVTVILSLVGVCLVRAPM
jgi:hypothetical protein